MSLNPDELYNKNKSLEQKPSSGEKNKNLNRTFISPYSDDESKNGFNSIPIEKKIIERRMNKRNRMNCIKFSDLIGNTKENNENEDINLKYYRMLPDNPPNFHENNQNSNINPLFSNVRPFFNDSNKNLNTVMNTNSETTNDFFFMNNNMNNINMSNKNLSNINLNNINPMSNPNYYNPNLLLNNFNEPYHSKTGFQIGLKRADFDKSNFSSLNNIEKKLKLKKKIFKTQKKIEKQFSQLLKQIDELN